MSTSRPSSAVGPRPRTAPGGTRSRSDWSLKSSFSASSRLLVQREVASSVCSRSETSPTRRLERPDASRVAGDLAAELRLALPVRRRPEPATTRSARRPGASSSASSPSAGVATASSTRTTSAATQRISIEFAGLRGYSSAGVRSALQRGRCGLPERAELAAVVVVGDLPGAMVELELLERRERTVALLDERRAEPPRPRSARRAGRRRPTARGGTAARRAATARAASATPAASASAVTRARARVSSRAGAARARPARARPPSRAGRRCPAIQIRLTSGLTSTLT